MKNRLKKAVGVYFAKVTEHNQPGRVSFFLTGGYTTGHNESEASVMRRWLLDGTSSTVKSRFAIGICFAKKLRANANLYTRIWY
jgi:hypothetical protein